MQIYLAVTRITFIRPIKIITFHVTKEKSFIGSPFIDYFWSKKEGKILITLHWYRIILNPLTTNVPHHIETSQLILHCKSIDWFLYDGEHWSLMG